MSVLTPILNQTGRNFKYTWRSQILTFLTILLSVLIFSFFYLIYDNVINAGRELGNDLRLIAYLDEEPGSALQEEYRQKILRFDNVEKIIFVDRKQAYERFKEQLADNKDILEDIPEDFLPPSIEVHPVRSLDSLTRIKRFSDYLQTLPGVLKVQYGQEWIERFYAFAKLMRIVVLLSGTLLILTTTFMVAHTIRLTLISRQQELELLRLVGATTNYIRMPFFLEGALQGLFGSAAGLTALYFLFNWIILRFADTAIFALFPFSFFSVPVLAGIIAAATLLCASGSFSSTRKILYL